MRLLALLLVLAALLALGTWWIGRADRTGAIESAQNAPALEPVQGVEAQLQSTAAAAARQEQRALDEKPAGTASATRIHGRVVRGKNALPVAGIEVICTKQPPPMRLGNPVLIERNGRLMLAPEQAVEPQEFTCRSGPDGSFEIADLDSSALYTLGAHVPGQGLVEPIVDAAPSEEERTLVVRCIYIARVLATDENGKPPMTACEYLRYARVPAPGECASLPLASIPGKSSKKLQLPPGMDPLPDAPGQEYAFSSDCEVPRLGPFRILICCAGFQRQDFEFWAYPEGMAADLTEFRLQRTSFQAGVLRVVQECGCKESTCEHLLEGELHLEPVDGSQKPLEFKLTGLAREQVCADLPVGSWRLRVRARNGGFCYPGAEAVPLEVTVGAEPAVVQLPVASLGMIRWSLRGPGEEPVGRPLELNWQGSGPGETATLWTSLVMRGLESGPQVFELSGRTFDLTDTKLDHVEGARDVSSGVQMRIEVDVLAGETRTVVVHLR